MTRLDGDESEEISAEIRRELREGTPNTPERIATMQRADATYAGEPRPPSEEAKRAAFRKLWGKDPEYESAGSVEGEVMCARDEDRWIEVEEMIAAAYAVDRVEPRPALPPEPSMPAVTGCSKQPTPLIGRDTHRSHEMAYRVAHLDIGVGAGFVDQQEVITTDAGELFCSINRYVREYVPGARINGKPVELADVRDEFGPTYTRGEPFPYSPEAKLMAAALNADRPEPPR